MKSEETKFGNGFERNKDLDEKLASMAMKDLDSLLLKLQAADDSKIKKQILNIDTSKYIIPWNSPAGRAYPKWAADILCIHPRGISKGDKVFLHNIVMRAIMLDEDNVHHLRWLGDRHKTNPTTGDSKRDDAIWSYVYGHTSWKEMKAGKVAEVGNFGRRH